MQRNSTALAQSNLQWEHHYSSPNTSQIIRIHSIFHADHGPPPNPRAEGDDIDVLFRLFLIQIKERGYAQRMPVQPLACRDPIKLHELSWKMFTHHVSWGSMTLVEKQRHFRSWLVRKFSLDPNYQCMMPGSGSKRLARNEAVWKGFWLTESELDELVKSIFEDYATQH